MAFGAMMGAKKMSSLRQRNFGRGLESHLEVTPPGQVFRVEILFCEGLPLELQLWFQPQPSPR